MASAVSSRNAPLMDAPGDSGVLPGAGFNFQDVTSIFANAAAGMSSEPYHVRHNYTDAKRNGTWRLRFYGRFYFA